MELIKNILSGVRQHEDSHRGAEQGIYPPDGISTDFHDKALVCSANRHVTGEIEEIKERLAFETGALDRWVEEEGGITGHIKAIVSANSPVCRISATAGEVDIKELPIKNFHVSLVAIVFEIEKTDLEKRVKSLMEGLVIT
ncbi:MAG: hypothetical protein GX654_04245 [Desulfatiglans sp.]|nr:hypothetical protein [Desulfatiglans sp.]